MTDREIIGRLRKGEPLRSFLRDEEVLDWRKSQNPYRLSRRVGMELEFLTYEPRDLYDRMVRNGLSLNYFDRYRSGTASNSWELKTDASVQLPEGPEKNFLMAKNYPVNLINGMEIASPPLTASTIKDVNKICAVLTEKCSRSGLDRAQINETCSLHVHVDVTHNPIAERASIYYTYVSIRDQLEQIIADHRIYGAGGMYYAKNHQPTLYGETLKQAKYNDIRTYSYVSGDDINGGSGTFEYRKGHPTKDPWSIKGWMSILDAIHLYGENNIIECRKDLNFYDVVHYPILWDIFNARKDFLFKRAKLNRKWGRDPEKKVPIVNLNI